MLRKKKISTILLLAGIVILFALTGCGSKRIAVTNSGIDVVKVKVEGSETKNMLGPNGTGYFDIDSKIQIGDTAIKFDRRIEVVNTGSGQIQIAYQDATGFEQTILLGEGETGYLRKSTPFKIGDVSIGVCKMK